MASQMPLVLKNHLPMQETIRDTGSIHGLGRSSGGGHGNPFQYSCLENPHGQRSLAAYVHKVAKNQTQLKQQHTSTIFKCLNYFGKCLCLGVI